MWFNSKTNLIKIVKQIFFKRVFKLIWSFIAYEQTSVLVDKHAISSLLYGEVVEGSYLLQTLAEDIEGF